MLFAEKNMPTYLGFCQGLSGYYMEFMNYIGALTFRRKFLNSFSFYFWVITTRKRDFPRPNILRENYPYHPHCVIYHHQKAKKSFFRHKSLRVMKFLRGLSDRALFESLVMKFYLGFLVMALSSGSSVIVLPLGSLMI